MLQNHIPSATVEPIAPKIEPPPLGWAVAGGGARLTGNSKIKTQIT